MGFLDHSTNNIALTSPPIISVSQGIRACLKLLTGPGTGKRPGVMIPIPQYPLYSASLAEYNMDQVRSIIHL